MLNQLLSKKPAFLYTGPATHEDIEKAEAALQLRFSKEYKEYLQQFGVATFQGHELTGITKSNRLNVVSVTEKEREKMPTIPNSFYVLEEAHIDGIVIWQIVSGEVFQTQYGTAEVKLLYKSLVDYIEACK